jgi:hypothetical protein
MSPVYNHPSRKTLLVSPPIAEHHLRPTRDKFARLAERDHAALIVNAFQLG